MSEIEKMYRNVGLFNMWVERYNDGYYEHERYYNSYKEMINNMMKANGWTLSEAQEVAKRECRKEHPSFTAEQQIVLLQTLIFSNKAFSIGRVYPHNIIQINDNKYVGKGETFGEAIAEIINKMWRDLTEEEKQQVKGILE